MEDIRLMAEFDGYKKSTTNEYLFKKIEGEEFLVKTENPNKDVIDGNTVYTKHPWVNIPKFGQRLSSMKYKESFDWLIPVIKKCKSIADDADLKFKGYHFDLLYKSIINSLETLNTETVFSTVLFFIKEYNEHLKPSDGN